MTLSTKAACGVDWAIEIMRGKWTMEVLYELMHQERARFGELCRALPGASSKTLTDRLRTLEAQGMIARTVYAEVPPHVEYTLTAKGRSFRVVIDAMLRWGEELVALEQ
jgi:DNA-binding HxlR family transcriptional regulator